MSSCNSDVYVVPVLFFKKDTRRAILYSLMAMKENYSYDIWRPFIVRKITHPSVQSGYGIDLGISTFSTQI